MRYRRLVTNPASTGASPVGGNPATRAEEEDAARKDGMSLRAASPFSASIPGFNPQRRGSSPSSAGPGDGAG